MKVRKVYELDKNIDMVVCDNYLIAVVCDKRRYGVRFIEWHIEDDFYQFTRNIVLNLQEMEEESIVRDYLKGLL